MDARCAVWNPPRPFMEIESHFHDGRGSLVYCPVTSIPAHFKAACAFYRNGSVPLTDSALSQPSEKCTAPRLRIPSSTPSLHPCFAGSRAENVPHNRPETAAVQESCKSSVARGRRTVIQRVSMALHKRGLSPPSASTCSARVATLAC